MNYIIECVYVVVFYRRSNSPANVKIAGTYIEREKAIERILEIFGNNVGFSNNNTVISNGSMVGWINQNDIGNYNNFNLNINQPYNSIKLIL